MLVIDTNRSGDKNSNWKGGISRFWNFVDKTPGHGPWGNCWLWTGNLRERRKGSGHYRGKFKLDGRWQSASRVCWRIIHGEDCKLQVLHSCDIGHCMNPDHLFQGTQIDNMEDMKRKKRGTLGRRMHSKLTEEQVIEIRKIRSTGVTLKSIAQRFNISISQVHGIAKLKRWRSVIKCS